LVENEGVVGCVPSLISESEAKAILLQAAKDVWKPVQKIISYDGEALDIIDYFHNDQGRREKIQEMRSGSPFGPIRVDEYQYDLNGYLSSHSITGDRGTV
jgi:hypothetical protein